MEQPELYEKKKVAAVQDAAEFIPRFISDMEFRENQKILDFGCGPGSVANKFFLPLAEKYNSHIFGVDISQSMIRYAEENHSSNRMTFNVGDLMADDWKQQRPFDQTYDHIFSIYVLHHIQDYYTAISRLFQLLNPGGYFAATVMSARKIYVLNQTLKEHPIWGKYMKTLHIPDWGVGKKDPECCFLTAMEDAGFEDPEVRMHQRTCEFKGGIPALADALMSVNPCTHLVTDLKERKDLRNFYIQEIGKWSDCFIKDDGSVVSEYDMITLFGMKI